MKHGWFPSFFSFLHHKQTYELKRYSYFTFQSSNANHFYKCILRYPKLIDFQDSKGNTILSFFCLKSSNLKKIQSLLFFNPNINVQNYEGYTPIMNAVIKGNILKNNDIVNLLLYNGADPFIINIYEANALHLSCIYKPHYSIIQSLLLYGISVNSQDIDGWTPLMILLYNYNTIDNKKYMKQYNKCINCLLKEDIDINIQDNEGYTILMYAILYCNDNIIKTIMKYNPNYKQKNNNNQTAYELLKQKKYNIVKKSSNNNIFSRTLRKYLIY